MEQAAQIIRLRKPGIIWKKAQAWLCKGLPHNISLVFGAWITIRISVDMWSPRRPRREPSNFCSFAGSIEYNAILKAIFQAGAEEENLSNFYWFNILHAS
ncbi:hypothetical protein KSS87_018675 [Heliosperma pusillum]|nr:hypothetical protein KSS87_018675 [Heliosperma pusillum]